MAWLRTEYRALRARMVGRGYGAQAELDRQAAIYANTVHGPEVPGASDLLRGLRFYSGLRLANADHEYADTRLA